MLIDNDIKLDFCDVLLKPKRSELTSRKDMQLEREFISRWGKQKFKCVPIIASNMATGTFEMAKVFSKYNMLVAIHKFKTQQEWQQQTQETLNHCIYTIGMSDEEYIRFKETRNPDYDNQMLCVDIANGYQQKFAKFISKIREENPKLIIIAGNVATPEMVQELVINGADFVKVGIGPGSECTTRLKTGVGYPQISAGIECSDAAHGLGAGIVLDGGIRSPGDAAKAFATNADMIMIGGMFAGTDEQEGEIITRSFLTDEVFYPSQLKDMNLSSQDFIDFAWNDNLGKIKRKIEYKKFKKFYGMSSTYALEKHYGVQKDYRTSEGKVEEVPYKGPVENVIQDLLGGLRSAGTYIGAKKIKDFGKCATFVQVRSRIHDKF